MGALNYRVCDLSEGNKVRIVYEKADGSQNEYSGTVTDLWLYRPGKGDTVRILREDGTYRSFENSRCVSLSVE